MSIRMNRKGTTAFHKLYLLIAILFLIAISISCGEKPVFPGTEWERIADPESIGFSKDGWLELLLGC